MLLNNLHSWLRRAGLILSTGWTASRKVHSGWNSEGYAASPRQGLFELLNDEYLVGSSVPASPSHFISVSTNSFSFQANEMLLSGRKLTAQEACGKGLVSQVFWPGTFTQEVMVRIKELAACNPVVCGICSFICVTFFTSTFSKPQRALTFHSISRVLHICPYTASYVHEK